MPASPSTIIPVPLSTITGVFFLAIVPFSGPGYILPERIYVGGEEVLLLLLGPLFLC